MASSSIDKHCGNCAIDFHSASMIFTTVVVNDEINWAMQEIPILDAIMHIYGFSATNIASAFLDDERDDNSPSLSQVTETSEYLIRHGLPLCSNCVSAFKDVYMAYQGLKKLSREAAILTKVINKFSPTNVKIEIDTDNIKAEDEDSITHATNNIRLVETPPENKRNQKTPTEAMTSESEDIFQEFDFEQECDDFDDDHDVKTDPLADTELTNASDDSTDIHANVYNNIDSRNRHRKSPSHLQDSDFLRKNIDMWKEAAIPTAKKRSHESNCGAPSPSSGITEAFRTRNQLTARITSLQSNCDKIGKTSTENNKTKSYVRPKKSGGFYSEERREKSRQVLLANIKKCRRKSRRIGKRRKIRTAKKNIGRSSNTTLEDGIAEKICNSDSLRGDEFQQQHHENVKNANDNSVSKKTPILQTCKYRMKQRFVKCSCGRAYKNIECLKLHERSHVDQEPVTCDVCGQSFDKNYLLYAHKEKDHAISFQCNLCETKFASRRSLQVHQSSNNSTASKSFICGKCGCSCHTAMCLRRHEHRLHGDENSDSLFECNECGDSYTRNYDLEKHVKLKHGTRKSFNCSHCEKNFISFQNLKLHTLRVHSDKNNTDILIMASSNQNRLEEEKILKCSCGDAFISLGSLRQHEKNHETQEPLICDICGESFKKNYLMYGHKSMEHSEFPQIIFKCNFCEKKFLSKNHLKSHEQRHHSADPRSFICEKCGKSFSCQSYLTRHKKYIHESEGLDKELFRCKECGLSLKHSDSLKRHMIRMHGTQKTFICHQCGKETKSMTNMRIHMKVHDPNRDLKRKSPSSTLKQADQLLN